MAIASVSLLRGTWAPVLISRPWAKICCQPMHIVNQPPNLFNELMTIANFSMMERHISSSVNTLTIGTESLSTNAKSGCQPMCNVNQPLNWFYELMTIASFSMMERHISSIGNTMTSDTESLFTTAKLGESMPNHAIHGHKCVKWAVMHTKAHKLLRYPGHKLL